VNQVDAILWKDLSDGEREAFTGKLAGMWGAATDEAAFNSWAVDKQQALLLVFRRMQAKNLWQVVRKVDNVYGEGGVGIGFSAWPFIESTLRSRKDFTRLFANRKDTDGGFYEKGRPAAVLHFVFVEDDPRKWFVHFDWHSPVHSLISALKHLRYEALGKITPNWLTIARVFQAESASQRGA
jgi:hypothetical protein